VYVVDDDGQVFTSQVASNNPVGCSQPSHTLDNSIALSESDDDPEYDYDMGDFANSAQNRSEEQAEVAEITGWGQLLAPTVNYRDIGTQAAPNS
jgi:hypothetical protein